MQSGWRMRVSPFNLSSSTSFLRGVTKATVSTSNHSRLVIRDANLNLGVYLLDSAGLYNLIICMREPCWKLLVLWGWRRVLSLCFHCVLEPETFCYSGPHFQCTSVPLCLKHLQNEMILNPLHMILKEFRSWKFSHFTRHALWLSSQKRRNYQIKH